MTIAAKPATSEKAGTAEQTDGDHAGLTWIPA
jgi:hypothetical protein